MYRDPHCVPVEELHVTEQGVPIDQLVHWQSTGVGVSVVVVSVGASVPAELRASARRNLLGSSAEALSTHPSAKTVAIEIVDASCFLPAAASAVLPMSIIIRANVPVMIDAMLMLAFIVYNL